MAHKVKNEKRIVLVCLVCEYTWVPRKKMRRTLPRKKLPCRVWGVSCPNCKSEKVMMNIEEVKEDSPRWIPL
jgi:hypothetical protein